MRAWLVLVIAVAPASCLRSTQFHCERDGDCGAGGTCEANGACSFFDASCASEQRFDSSAGSLANSCVPEGGVPPVDAGVDARPVDAPPGSCPPDYVMLPMGGGSRYRLIASPREWSEQRDDCADDRAGRTYLGVPRNAPELRRMVELHGSNKLWLGLDDRATDGTWVAADGAPVMFLPWKPGSPSQSEDNDRDCVAADSETQIIDDDCEQEYAAVCECEE